jgi:hypothetical protein
MFWLITAIPFAFWLGTLIGSKITAKLIRNQEVQIQIIYSKPMVQENMYPYDVEMDEKFLSIIDNFKRGK